MHLGVTDDRDADPELAVFLNMLELFREGLGRKATLVLDNSLPGIMLFSPEVASDVQQGHLPDLANPNQAGLAESDDRAPARSVATTGGGSE